jgi:hypothetical protein
MTNEAVALDVKRCRTLSSRGVQPLACAVRGVPNAAYRTSLDVVI